jgi:HAD superfamily hydrolase (TIGR01509 family)
MLRAIIFDFNGVILDDEPLHFAAMRDAVAHIGISITKEEYWRDYLPLDDWRCLQAICEAHSFHLTQELMQQVLEQKAKYHRQLLNGHYSLFPGAAEFVRTSADRYPLAIASGARRAEVESALKTAGLHPYFRAILAAEDFVRGKPHPECYLSALGQLNDRRVPVSPVILPQECLVIEDSLGGVRGARAAGMVCLAVSNTYPAEQLGEADAVTASLEEVNLDDLEALVEGRS